MCNTEDRKKQLEPFAAKNGFGYFDEKVNRNTHIFIGASLPTSGHLPYHMVAENNAHPVVIGSTGSNKTTAILIPNILWKQNSFVAVDPKGEIVKSVAPYLEKRGFKIVAFDPYGVSDTPTATFDPVASLRFDDPLLAAKIDKIAEALVKVSSQEESHWDNSARNLLAGVIAFVVENEDENKSLTRALDLLQGGVGVICEIIRSLFKNKQPSIMTRRKLGRYAELSPESRETQSVLSTLLTQLQFLDSDPIRKVLSSSTFRFEELLDPKSKVAVFITLPPDKLESDNKYQRLMISQVISTISNVGGNPDNPIDLYIDEAGTIGTLPTLSQAVGIMRSYGLRVWTFFQTLSQLKRDYPKDYQNFIGNSGTLILLKAMDLETAQFFSEKLGKISIFPNQEHMLNGLYGASELQTNRRGLPNDTSHRLYDLLSPVDLCQLPDNVGIVFTDGSPSLFMKTPYYETIPFMYAT